MKTIGQLAKEAGVNTQTIRFYERKGLLPPPQRQGSGDYRVYREKDAERLSFILRAKAAGFTLADIQELADASESPEACHDVAGLVGRRLEEVRAKLKELQRLRRHLEHLQRQCVKNQDKEHCPVVEGLDAAAG